MRLTRNFKLSEFTFSETALRKGIDNTLPDQYLSNAICLASWLQALRNRLTQKYDKDMPIVITSGYRSPKLNKEVGGSKTSVHRFMLAADIHVPGLSIQQLQRAIVELMEDRPYDQCIDEYSGWVHLGLSPDNHPRMQNLIARKVRKNWGNLTTQYTPLRVFG
jgi:hypothetical protein